LTVQGPPLQRPKPLPKSPLAKSGGYVAPVTTPIRPLVGIVFCGLVAVVLAFLAFSDDAGQTDEVSTVALVAWIIGSVIGLLFFAWFRSADAKCQANSRYLEPAWRPRLVALYATAIGWIAGSAGAIFVAQAVARQ
jgi:hypothetical protein